MRGHFDVVVIGAGFGGLGAALSLAERGANVCLIEALKYPGGCASTFARRVTVPGEAPAIHRFESGATIASGLGPDQLLGRWIARYAPSLEIEWGDPLVELRTPQLRLPVTRDREATIERLCALPGAPRAGIRAFFDEQRRVADVLWALFDDPSVLPPLDARAVVRHLGGALRYASLVPRMGRPLEAVLRAHEVEGFAPLRTFVDALAQITVQCPSAEAEAPFALAAMDYYHRGTGHVIGGFGALAWALADGCTKAGGTVRMACRARSIARTDDGYRVLVGSGGETITARSIVANVLPGALAALFSGSLALPTWARDTERAVEDGWSAVMRYAVADAPEGASPHGHHLELVHDPARPLTEGNHVFVSISSAAERDRAPNGRRTITMSTHVPLRALAAERDRGAYVDAVRAAMTATVRARAPEWAERIVAELPGSPRTFERFTGRKNGAVGGVPRRAGLGHYLRLWPAELARDVYLVGDSVLFGQSALATAIGGARTAATIASGRAVVIEPSSVPRLA